MRISPAFPNDCQSRPKTRVVILACWLIAAAMTGLTAHAGNLEEASDLLKAGQHAKALEQVDQHLANQPKDAQGRFLKGIILTGMNRQSEAIAVFKKLSEDYPKLPEPYNNLAVIYAQQKQYGKAKEALEMAIRTHPAYATAHENLGDIYSRLASQAYGKALQIDSANASAQTKLAMINELVGTGKSVPTTAAPTTPVPVAPVILAGAKPAETTKPVETVKPAPAASATAKPASEAKPVEPAKPVETAKPAGVDAEVTAAVDSWLAAWSKKDVKTYLAHYAQDFETPRGLSRKDWEAERAQRVGKPGKIEVNRDKLNIKTDGAEKATVRFRQGYRSASFKSSSGKTLVLVKRNGKWLILKEQTG